MSAKITDLYFLRCLTNTHVGSGDSTYGIVDKVVQRDVITELPVIHSSGLKGSFRELMAYIKKPDNPQKGHEDPAVEAIFGSKKDSDPDIKLSQGSHIFYDASLLVIPVRSNVSPFFRATSIERLREFLDKVEMYISVAKKDSIKTSLNGLLTQTVTKNKPLVFTKFNGDIRIESWTAEYKEIDFAKADSLLGKNLVLLHDDDLKSLCGELPVIARNKLENGISSNLWYEEVVPRESLFYSFVAYSSGETILLWANLNSTNLLQVGGNATIGYGLCKIERP